MLLQLLEEMLTLIGGLLVAYFVYILLVRKDDKPTTDPPTMAHTALREIVERAVVEARKLPGLNNSTETRANEEGRNIAEHSYEDLLATAILNKVIEKFQREQVDGNSNVLHEKLATKAKPSPSESELGLDEGVEEGCSSLEPLSQDECSDSSASCSRHLRNRSEPMSLTIEERIEEVTTTYTSDEEHRENDVLPIRNSHRVPFPELGMDIIDPSQESSEDSQDEPSTPTSHIDMVSPVESWEENWLFQKKKVQKQADPVAMLVPNPSADFKALIGDKDAEDTSDLSECSSAQSDEEIEKELMEAISNVVPRSPKKKEFYTEAEVKALANDFQSIPQISIEEVEAVDYLSNGDNEANQKTENLVDLNGTCELNHSKEERTEVLKNDQSSQEMINNYSVKSDEQSKTKEAEEKSEICEAKIENKSVPVETIDKKVESESKEPKLESKGVEISEKTESENSVPKEKIIVDVIEDTNRSFTIKSVDENPVTEDTVICDLPKTPSCTPVRASLDDDVFNYDNDKAIIDAREEKVLNSLESAKKKLMVNDEDETGKLVDEEAKDSTDQKVYLGEDAQQESEYTEHYDIATQRHLDSLTKIDTTNAEMYNEDKSESNLPEGSIPAPDNKSTDVIPVSLSEKEETNEDAQLFTPPRPGTIAEREHKKWENAPPIENNPYSEENIQIRLWQRQYSRRLSDIPRAHTELTNSNGTDLEVDLTPNQPDITRFGRDYYINNSKSAPGDRGWRSGSSRPNSSLSQRSSSTTSADHEQQVSFELESFESASLRESRTRWVYLDPRSSPHFAINPLLHLELDHSNDNSVQDSASINEEDTRELVINGTAIINADEARQSSFVGNRYIESGNGLGLEEYGEKVVFNPLYEVQQENLIVPDKCNADRDSGMYSTDSYDYPDPTGEKGSNNSDRLSLVAESQSHDKENQILCTNGKRFLNTGYTCHTFGGIKVTLGKSSSGESDDENPLNGISNDTIQYDPPEFSKLKFQTFGGIKKDRKLDNRRLPIYGKMKSRSTLRSPKSTKSQKNIELKSKDNYVDVDSVNDLELRLSEDDCWQDQDTEDVPAAINSKSRSSKYRNVHAKRRVPRVASTGSLTTLRRNMSSSSCLSSYDDEWEDDVSSIADQTEMPAFLPRKLKSHLFMRNQSQIPRKTSTKKGSWLDDNDSLRLEAPIVPEVVNRTFQSLKDLRQSTKVKQKRKEPIVNKKLGVRSLSDLTIW